MNMHESVFASFNDFSPFKYIQSTYPPVTIPLYFIWPLNTQTRKHAHTRAHTHTRVSMHRSSSLTMCKVHANNYHFTGRFALSSPPLTLSQRYLSSQVPTKDNLEICERWEDLSDESPTGNVEKKAWDRGARETAGEGTLNVVCTITPIGVHMYCTGRREVFSVEGCQICIFHTRGYVMPLISAMLHLWTHCV